MGGLSVQSLHFHLEPVTACPVKRLSVSNSKWWKVPSDTSNSLDGSSDGSVGARIPSSMQTVCSEATKAAYKSHDELEAGEAGVEAVAIAAAQAVAHNLVPLLRLLTLDSTPDTCRLAWMALAILEDTEWWTVHDIGYFAECCGMPPAEKVPFLQAATRSGLSLDGLMDANLLDNDVSSIWLDTFRGKIAHDSTLKGMWRALHFTFFPGYARAQGC
jgi:hypothetical protein